MKRFIALSGLFALLVLGMVIWLTPSQSDAIAFYAEKIRNSLFTGLLTVGSFLLSLKVFIVVKFKENVFDSKEYVERLAARRRIDPRIEHYGPVRKLSKVLFLSILAALIASASQITVGLIDHPIAFMFCIGAAAFAAAMLLQTLLLIRTILNEWLDHMEK